MVLSILIATLMAPGLLGSQEAIRQSQSQEKREEHRARRCNLIATCVKSSTHSRDLNGRPVVLRDGKLWIDTGTDDTSPSAHQYAGYYLPYPDSKYEGLVTTITDVAPVMNWVYIDKDTHEAKYGVRVDAQPNLTGPFGCTRQDRRLTFDGWEGWCAVQERPGQWALYFDLLDDGLRAKVSRGTKVLEIELGRKEKRFQRENTARQQDQTTKRAVNTEGEAPVDQPLAAEALVSKPGVVDASSESGLEEPAPLRPLNIPKSIFDDPLPMVAPLLFSATTPKTPPPAYSPVADSMLPDTAMGSALPPELSKNQKVSVEARDRKSTTRNTREPSESSEVEAKDVGQQAKTVQFENSNSYMSEGSDTEDYTPSECPPEGEMVGEKSELGDSTLPHISLTPPPLMLAGGKSKAWVQRERAPETLIPSSKRPTEAQGLSTRRTFVADPAISSPTSARKERASSRPGRPSIARQPSGVNSTVQGNSSKFAQKTEFYRARQRSDSSPSHVRSNSSFSTPREDPVPRQSLARTMTTGTGNQGMTNRIVERNALERPVLRRYNSVVGKGEPVVGRKTTSALFREIDDLVRQDTGENLVPRGIPRVANEKKSENPRMI